MGGILTFRDAAIEKWPVVYVVCFLLVARQRALVREGLCTAIHSARNPLSLLQCATDQLGVHSSAVPVVVMLTLVRVVAAFDVAIVKRGMLGRRNVLYR